MILLINQVQVQQQFQLDLDEDHPSDLLFHH